MMTRTAVDFGFVLGPQNGIAEKPDAVDGHFPLSDLKG
jgi:hypothetical protein